MATQKEFLTQAEIFVRFFISPYSLPGFNPEKPPAISKSMRRLLVMLTALMLATVQTDAESLAWLLDVARSDEVARKEAQFLVWDGVPHPPSASFEKINIIDKEWPFYLFHVVITSSRGLIGRERSSYLVCFKLGERTTEFRIVTVIQYASDPPTKHEIAIDKRLNRWPVSPPSEIGDELPRRIRGSGLSIVLDRVAQDRTINR